MWILLISFAIVAISKGAASRDMCLHRVIDTCSEPNTLYDIPRDAEELMSSCSSWGDFLECLNGYDLACSGRSHFTALGRPLKHSKLRHVLDEFCDVGSVHYRALLLHLPCIRHRIARKSYLCKNTQDEVQRSYMLHKKTDPERMHSAPAAEKECLRSISYLVCMLKVIEVDCGYSAYKELDKIITESQLWPFWCGYETAVDLQHILNDMDLDKTLEESLKKYLTV